MSCSSVKAKFNEAKAISKTDQKEFRIKGEHSSAQTVERAFLRLKDQLSGLSFVPWKFHARGSTFQPDIQSFSRENQIQKVVIILNNGSSIDQRLKVGDLRIDESYTLDIPTIGDIRLAANHTVGILYGFQTILQLFNKQRGVS
jgi:beta-acetyl hexosaminidase like